MRRPLVGVSMVSERTLVLTFFCAKARVIRLGKPWVPVAQLDRAALS